MSSDAPLSLAPAALIVGCGYLGRRIAARLIAERLCVYGTTRSAAHAAGLAQIGVRPMILSVTQRVTLAAIRPAIEAERLDVYYLVPPGAASARDAHTPREVAIDGPRNVLAALNSARIRRAVMASSTAVYGQTNNTPVDADTPAQPADDRARLLLESEEAFFRGGPHGHILRLAGLYGPARVIGLAAVREGSPVAGNPDGLLNLIHVDDAADLMIALMRAPSPARVELGCDGHPVTRITYYRYLSQLLHVAEPAVLNDTAAAALGLDTDRLRRASSKACGNGPTCRRTGWQPRYRDFQAGLQQAMTEA